MDKVEALERQVSRLSLSVRLGVGTLVCAYAIRCVSLLMGVPYFRGVFNEMLEGEPLPSLTLFFLAFSVPICGVVLILAIVAVLALTLWRDRLWGLPFSIVLTIVCISITELASVALMQPLFSMVAKLGGR